MESATATHPKLLQIAVPVSVTLAHAPQSIGAILQWKPGTLIRLNKPCGDPLDLCVGHRLLARGQAVRIGDRIGLRIQHIAPPSRP